MSGPVISAEGIGLSRSGLEILSGIDLEINLGEFLVILGPNGAGKTSLLRLLAAIDRPSFGKLEILGELVGRSDMRALRRRIGSVSPVVLDRFMGSASAFEVVLTGTSGDYAPYWHRYSQFDMDATMEQLRRVDLLDRMETPVDKLSAGERQRLLLARALVGEPELLILDEPAAGLDFPAREDLLEILGGVIDTDKRRPGSVVMVTHHVEEIPRAANSVLLLKSGKVLVKGRVNDVLSSENLSNTFSRDVAINTICGRFFAIANSSGSSKDGVFPNLKSKWSQG